MSGGTTKRRSPRLMIVAALMALLAALVLGACGGGSDSSSGGATADTSTEAGGGSTIDSPEAKEFLKYTGISEKAAEALQGQTFKLGAILPLTGAGAGFATEEQNGILLAKAQMEEYLGLEVDYQVLDHKTGDPQAGAAAARQLGIDGFGTAVNSYYAVFGSTLPELQKYKVLSIDPGGGTGNLLKGQEYFWGGRANTPDDAFPGLRYFKGDPNAKRVALVDWDAGSEYYEPLEEHFKEEVATSGLTFAGAVHTKIGETDYSATISELRALEPDVIWLAIYGTEPGYFMKQYVTSGMSAQVVGSEYTPTGAKVAGSAYDDYIFAQDYFNFEEPTNPFAEFFLKTYEEHFGEKAEVFFEPNYYEAGIVYAILAARIAEEGGDINDGELMNQKLEEDPEFASVYGGSATEAGTLAFDTKTHDPSIRPVAMFRATVPQELLAEWNIGGTDFKVVSK